MPRSCRPMPGTARRGFLLSRQHGQDIAINSGGNPRHRLYGHVVGAGFYRGPKALIEAMQTRHGPLRKTELLTAATNGVTEVHT